MCIIMSARLWGPAWRGRGRGSGMASGMASLPAHKLIPGTGFIVDGFKFKSPLIKQYFLSHAHSGPHSTICIS